ncbi:MAG: DUF3810 domain-containing protein [Eubacteriales bacterium]|nr:DUF3810 domain-containing protein [Eubacteriales bacterium]
MGRRRGGRGRWFFLAVLLGASAVLNLAAWNSEAFADAYVRRVFPLWSETYGRLTGLAPFSVGEVMIVLGVLWLIALMLTLAVTAVLSLCGAGKRLAGRERGGVDVSLAGGEHGDGKVLIAVRWRRFSARFTEATAWLLAAVLLVMTLNCFILYQATGLTDGSKEWSEQERALFYSKEQLALLRDYIVEQANVLAGEVPRNEAGEVVFQADVREEAIAAMQRLSQEYPQLSGYYPQPKGMAFSDLMSQSYMQGYYFPFSMEANYNTTMAQMNVPFTLCHELSHLKGYIKEDDANMLGFLACIGSDDPAFVYSGYLGVLNYVNNDFYDSIGKNREVYASHVEISALVKADNTFLTDDAWKKVEEKAIISTKTARAASVTFTDTTLKVNGVSEGILSYNQVVEKLLAYYQEEEPLNRT